MISPILNELFDPNHVVLELRTGTAREAIWEVIERLRDSGALREPRQFYDAVIEREQKNSTVVEGGVAFPHARTNIVDEIVLGIGRSKTGVTFAGENLVHLLFVIAVPQQLVHDYLVCVGALARVLKNEKTRRALLEAATPAEFFKQFRSAG